MKTWLVIVAILVILGGGYFLFFRSASAPTTPGGPGSSGGSSNIVPTTHSFGAVSMSGEIVCLPHRGGGAQTAECAIGLKGDDGAYYFLIGLNQQDLVAGKWAVGSQVMVSGTLAAPQESVYAVAGAITVGTIIEQKAQ